jgi:hypothetical protein
MNISIFGYSINLEILIFIGIIYIILVGHTFCGCCSINGLGFMEGLTTMATHDASNNYLNLDKQTIVKKDLLKTQVTAGGNSILPSVHEEVKVKSVGGKEGFTGANINYGESSSYNLAKNDAVDTNSWFQSNLSVVKGKSLSSGVTDFLNRPKQPIPLPEGEMLLFANTKFKPECCPNSYSNGSGCACMTAGQYNYLIGRGSNNTPYSEY